MRFEDLPPEKQQSMLTILSGVGKQRAALQESLSRLEDLVHQHSQIRAFVPCNELEDWLDEVNNQEDVTLKEVAQFWEQFIDD
jgi:hypothetical protein